MQHSLLSIIASLAVLITSTNLCFTQITPANSPQNKQVRDNKLEKLKKQAEGIGVGGKITVVKLGGQDFYGSVSQIESDGFQIIEIDSKQIVSFKYPELKKIHKGDGERNLVTGRRVNPRRGWIYATAILGTLAILLAVGLSDKDF